MEISLCLHGDLSLSTLLSPQCATVGGVMFDWPPDPEPGSSGLCLQEEEEGII